MYGKTKKEMLRIEYIRRAVEIIQNEDSDGKSIEIVWARTMKILFIKTYLIEMEVVRKDMSNLFIRGDLNKNVWQVTIDKADPR